MERFISNCLVILMTGAVAFGDGRDIPLVAPKLEPGVDLLTAFKMRQSTRAFTVKDVTLRSESTLLMLRPDVLEKMFT